MTAPASPFPPFAFPLAGGGPYLCSQSAGGGLTHWAHPSTFYACDLEAAVGTPVVAVADGTIHALQQDTDHRVVAAALNGLQIS